jgi:pyridoxine 5-phosphate synthase
LHTGQFAEHFPKADTEVRRLIDAANLAHSLGLKVNAGHGLNYINLPVFFQVPWVVELNIGHSIVSRAVLTGMEAAVRDLLAVMKGYRGGATG